MPREYRFHVYIAGGKFPRIYTKVTNHLERCIAKHRHGETERFTKGYNHSPGSGS